VNSEGVSTPLEIREVGIVESVRKLIVIAGGLPSCINGQLVDFENGSRGVVMGFTEDKVQILVISEGGEIRSGDEIYNRAEYLKLPVGDAFLGRIVNAICEPTDEKGPIQASGHFPVFQDAPGIMDRVPVDQALETGTMAIDAGIPIGLGQRQLLIGDRLTGKTTVAVDAILNQKKNRCHLPLLLHRKALRLSSSSCSTPQREKGHGLHSHR